MARHVFPVSIVSVHPSASPVACTPDAPVHDPSSAASADTRWLTSMPFWWARDTAKHLSVSDSFTVTASVSFSWCMGSRGFGVWRCRAGTPVNVGAQVFAADGAGGFALDVDAAIRRHDDGRRPPAPGTDRVLQRSDQWLALILSGCRSVFRVQKEFIR